MSSITINKLIKTSDKSGDNKNYIYLQIKWGDNEHNLKILDSESRKSYQGLVTTTTMKEIATDLDMPYNDYIEELRSALTTYLALPEFHYKLETEGEEKIFKICKSPAESIPIIFLDVDIKEVRSNNEILDSAIELLQQQDKSLTDRVEKAHKYDKNSRELLEDYRLCVEEKNELERKLLKKVAVLLNAKKERIALLEERLKKYEEVGEDDDDSEEMEEAPQSSKKRRLVVRDSESEDDDDYTADTQPLTLPQDETNN